MAQSMRPISTVTDQGTFTGPSAHGSVDGTAPDTGDYWTGNDNQDDVLEVLLTDLSSSPPGSGTCTVNVYQAESDTDSAPASGGTSPTYDIEVYEATTQIAARTGITATESAFTLDNALTFSSSSISDWSDVRVRFTSHGTGGTPSGRRGVATSYVEISTPDTAIAPITGSMAIAFSNTGDITPSRGRIEGRIQAAFPIPGTTTIAGLLQGAGTAAIVFGSIAHLDPIIGRVGKAVTDGVRFVNPTFTSLTRGKVAAAVAAIGAGPSAITGSAAITFASLADITPSPGNLAASEPVVFASVTDLTPSPGHIAGTSTWTFDSLSNLAAAITGNSAWVVASVADLTPSIGHITGSASIVFDSVTMLSVSMAGSAAITFASVVDLTPSPGNLAASEPIVFGSLSNLAAAVTGSAAIVFDSVADITPSVGSIAGSSAWAFASAADITPSTGHLTGTAASVFADPATAIVDVNAGFDPITGSLAITFGSLADITPSPGNITASEAVVFGSVADLAAALIGSANVIFASAADITPSLGNLTGSASVAFSSLANLTAAMVGSAAVVFDSVTDLTPAIGTIAGSAASVLGSTTEIDGLTALTGSASFALAAHGASSDANDVPSIGRVGVSLLTSQFRGIGNVFRYLVPSPRKIYAVYPLTGSVSLSLGATADITPSLGIMAGSKQIMFADPSTLIIDANGGFATLTGSASIVFGSSVVLGQVGQTGSALISLAGMGDLTPARGRIRAPEEVHFTLSADLIDAAAAIDHGIGIPLHNNFRSWGARTVSSLTKRVRQSDPIAGSMAIAFSGTGDLTPSPGNIIGSALFTFDDVTRLTDALQDAIFGTATITFADLVDITPSPGNLTGSASVIVSSTTEILDALEGPDEIAGDIPVTFTLSAGIVDIGDLFGSADIFFGEVATIRATGVMTGSANITFGSAAGIINPEPLIGGTLIRFVNSADSRGTGRMRGRAQNVLGDLVALRADVNDTGTAAISFGSHAVINNAGVDVVSGSMVISLAARLVEIKGKFVSWQEQTGKGGGWQKRPPAPGGWTKQSGDTGTWDKEAS